MSNEELAGLIKSGRRELTHELLAQNTGLIHATARRYLGAAARNRGADYDDLLQAAAVGLMEAAGAWDSERGAFSTVAVLYMRSEILKLLGLHTSKQRIENAVPPVSLYSEISDENDTQLIETIADPAAVDPCEAAAERDTLTAKVIHEELNSLTDDQRTVVTAHMLHGVPLRSCIEGRSAEACRCIEARALQKLRRSPRLIAMVDPFYRHKGVAAFKSSWSSCVEDAVMRREELLARIDETILALSDFDTTELCELRKRLLSGR